MPVEVKVSLSNCAIFIAGEQIECSIDFVNVDASNNADMLAWASAQILCQCSINEARFNRLTAQKSKSVSSGAGETSFIPNKGEQGFTAFSTKPSILFCNLQLRPGEKKSCFYRDCIPFEAPPSFRGHSIKYVYKIVVGIQKLNQPTQLLRLPIRVLSVPGLNAASVYQLANEEVQPANPFLEKSPANVENTLETALYLLSNITSGRQQSNYNLSNTRGSVVRFTLFKDAYKLGEEIIGVFDFSQSSIPCLQCTVTLQSEEKITTQKDEEQDNPRGIVSPFSQIHLSCLYTRQSPLSLHIPLNITPSFSTDLVSLTWRLNFEFITLTEGFPPEQPSKQDQPISRTPPESVDTETLIWTLPISIYPTNPYTLNGQNYLTSAVLSC